MDLGDRGTSENIPIGFGPSSSNGTAEDIVHPGALTSLQNSTGGS